MWEKYNMKFAVSAVRGYLKRVGKPELAGAGLIDKPLSDLTYEEQEHIIEAAESLDIDLYHYKNKGDPLPRVRRVLGFLKSIYFESLLDVGSGRGAFLIPFMDTFPYVRVKSVDILDKRVEMLSDLANGGMENLSVEKADICAQPYPDNSVDVVTMLEVLEHIPNLEAAINSAVRMAKKYVVVTVPSKEDNNPEHIHLLTKNKLTRLFGDVGVTKLSFDGVLGHLFMIADVGNDKNGL